MKNKHAQHGGAWKVAYADFVTAMMALFLVLWLTSQDQKIREAVERAFNHPFTSVTQLSTGIVPSDNIQAVRSTEGQFNSASKAELEILRRINEDLSLSLHNTADETGINTFALQLTPDSLRITVFDRAQRPIFERDTASLTPYGKWSLTTLAWTIARYPSFKIEVEGHTEKPGAADASLDLWELTTQRANAARRVLEEQGVAPEQLWRVTGYGDTMPMPELALTNPVNRRVTVMLKMQQGKRF